MKYNSLIITLVLLATACSSSGCWEERTSLTKAEFFSSQTGRKVSVSAISVGGVDAPNDSLLAKPTETIEELYLPLRQALESTSFFISITDANQMVSTETITINYSSQPFFISEECGASFNYYIKSVDYTGVLIDSIVVVNPDVTNAENVNLRFYIPTEPGI